MFLAPWSQNRLKKKTGAGAAREKNQEPEPEPIEKKVRSRSRKKICQLPSPGNFIPLYFMERFTILIDLTLYICTL